MLKAHSVAVGNIMYDILPMPCPPCLEDVVECFERQPDDVLDVSPLVEALD